MTNKKDILVFDIETQKSFEEVGGQENLEKLGVSLVGAYSFNEDKFLSFLENELGELEKRMQEAGLLVGFNSLAFDLPVLKPYFNFDAFSMPHLDIMRVIEDKIGHRVSLNSVASMTLGVTKSGDGLQAIEFYRKGKIEELKKYCLDDVKITRDIFIFGQQKGNVMFDTRKGIETVKVEWGLDKLMPEEEEGDSESGGEQGSLF